MICGTQKTGSYSCFHRTINFGNKFFLVVNLMYEPLGDVNQSRFFLCRMREADGRDARSFVVFMYGGSRPCFIYGRIGIVLPVSNFVLRHE